MSRTALAVARVRAFETAQPEPLFTDPYAQVFIEASGIPMDVAGPASPLAKRLVAQGILRTRHYDEQLMAAGVDQVVLLAAGLDARAFRLPWPEGTRVFELDLPPILAFKDRVLAEHGARPHCERIVLPLDLVDPDWPNRLRAAGFDAARPSAWLAEGLLVYLDADQAAGLLGAVGELAAPGSILMLEQGRDVSGTPREDGLTALTDLWRGGLGPGTADWLAVHGWQVEFAGLEDLAAGYGREMPPAVGPSTAGFLRARRIARPVPRPESQGNDSSSVRSG
ncbi:SAM-dependent methyltransferase [Catenulispora yoronensis]